MPAPDRPHSTRPRLAEVPPRKDWHLYSFEHQTYWLRAENDRLRRRLMKHHETENLPEMTIVEIYVSDSNECPICRNADEGR